MMLLMIMMFFFEKIPHRLKSLCTSVLLTVIVFLFPVLIYSYNGELAGILPPITSDGTQRDNLSTHVEKVITACSDNMFISRDDCLPCPKGTFSFSGWMKCEPLLNCSDIALQVQIKRKLQGGGTKQLWLAEWKGRQVAYLKCRGELRVKKRCLLHGMSTMEKLQSPFVTRLIGRCYEKRETVAMYYKHGSAETVGQLLQKPQFSQYNNIQTRFQLIVDYVKIMNYMHNSPIGIRVMCDTRRMDKLLSQYLITDDFHMVVNDLDVTPQVRGSNGMLCNNVKVMKQGGSVEWFAPEQRSHYRPGVRPKNDEKIDIWKIPAIVQELQGDVDGSSIVKSKLERVIKRCQATNPQERPTANEVLQELLRVKGLIMQ